MSFLTLSSSSQPKASGVIENVLEFTRSFGFRVSEVTYSPIKGPEGNIEYLMHISKQNEDNEIDIIDIVENSHTL